MLLSWWAESIFSVSLFYYKCLNHFCWCAKCRTVIIFPFSSNFFLKFKTSLFFICLVFICTLVFTCISYLLLHNKLPQNLSAFKTTVIISPSFWGSGLWEHLSWVVLLKNFHKVVVKMSSGTKVISRLDWTGESVSRLLNMFADKRHQFLAGSWPEALVLCHVDLPTRLHTAWQLASSRVRDRKWEVTWDRGYSLL